MIFQKFKDELAEILPLFESGDERMEALYHQGELKYAYAQWSVQMSTFQDEYGDPKNLEDYDVPIEIIRPLVGPCIHMALNATAISILLDTPFEFPGRFFHYHTLQPFDSAIRAEIFGEHSPHILSECLEKFIASARTCEPIVGGRDVFWSNMCDRDSMVSTLHRVKPDFVTTEPEVLN